MSLHKMKVFLAAGNLLDNILCVYDNACGLEGIFNDSMAIKKCKYLHHLQKQVWIGKDIMLRHEAAFHQVIKTYRCAALLLFYLAKKCFFAVSNSNNAKDSETLSPVMQLGR